MSAPALKGRGPEPRARLTASSANPKQALCSQITLNELRRLAPELVRDCGDRVVASVQHSLAGERARTGRIKDLARNEIIDFCRQRFSSGADLDQPRDGSAELRVATLEYCRIYYVAHWRDRPDTVSHTRRRFEQLQEQRVAEELAQAMVRALEDKCSVVVGFVAESPATTRGGYLELLTRLSPLAQAILDRLQRERSHKVIGLSPSLREWLVEQQILIQWPRATLRDLSVLSLLAGYWPDRVSGGGSVAKVLGVQDKDVRAAIANLKRLTSCMAQ